MLADPEGWQVKDEPLGASASASDWVARTLNFDQAVQRVYSRDTRQFTVFAAYWDRGKMPARAIAIHAPDCCWTRTGYTCVALKFRQTLAAPGIALLPAEWRVFDSAAGERSHVLFWLVAGGESFDFGDRLDGAGDPWVSAKALVRDAMLGCREAVFVTIAANVPIESLLDDPGFQDVLRGLARAGLAMPRANGPAS